MPHPLSSFDRVAIINLPERTDRRGETAAEIERIGGFDGGRIAFVDACRPTDAGPFPSIGARGCFMSHLSVLRQTRADGVVRLLILEDDVDFARDFVDRASPLLEPAAISWDLFYGAYGDQIEPAKTGWREIDPQQPLSTSSFMGFTAATVSALVPFLEAMLQRPAGSPDYGPMHVDGAYTVFRRLHPEVRCVAAVPPLAHQRSSRSNISDHQPLIDRIPLLHGLSNRLRRLRDGRGTR